MKHKRNVSLLLILALLLGMTLVTPGFVSGKTITLKYANFPPGPTFPCVQMERWKTEVEKRTNGKVKIQTFPGSTLLGPKTMLEGVISGIADIGCFCPSYQPGRFPVSEAIDLPINLVSARVGTLVFNDLVEKYNPKEFQQVKMINLFTCSPTHFMTSKPVRSLKDLRGMEIKTVGTGADVLKLLGGVPVAMPQSETPEAIQKGVVKGMLSGMEILLDFGFAAYCPYATMANLPVVDFAVVMNRDTWNALPSDVKGVIDSLRREHALWTATYYDNHVKESLEWSKQKYNHQIFQFPEADKREIPKLLKPLIDDYLKKVNALGLPGQQIVDDVYCLRDKYAAQYK